MRMRRLLPHRSSRISPIGGQRPENRKKQAASRQPAPIFASQYLIMRASPSRSLPDPQSPSDR